MSTTRIFSNPRPQFRKDDSTVNSNGRLYFREPGSNTTTLKSVYSDPALTIAYTNPVILDANGRAPVIYLDGDYNVQETTSAGAQIWRVDNYQPVAFEGQYNAWSAPLTYSVNDIVQYTDGKYYVSLQSANLAKTPSSSSVWWTEIFFIKVYNASETYSTEDIVVYLGELYTAYNGPHTGVTPGTDNSQWRAFGAAEDKADVVDVSYTYYRDDATASVSLSVDSILASGVFESIGPTGSGATNIWSGLNGATGAKVYLFHVTAFASKNTGTDEAFGIDCEARKTGGTSLFNAGSARSFGGGVTTPGQCTSACMVEVPADSSGRFDFRFINNGTPDAVSVNIYFLGYKL